MENGISIYPGLPGEGTIEENIALMEQASAAGLKRLFTSLQIPESDPEQLQHDLRRLLAAARKLDFEIISDVSPTTLQLLDMKEFNPLSFRLLGITTLRLDNGFSPADIARLTHTHGLKIQLNASTLTPSSLAAIMEAKADPQHLDAMHNFYPRRGTGLSQELIARRNLILHRLGIRVGAFVPSQHHHRGPLSEGLPTLEEHRDMPVGLAARHLVALGIDSVFIGDSLPGSDEIQALASVSEQPGEVCLNARLLTDDETARSLLQHTFTSRIDAARDVVRAQESRRLLREAGKHIAPDNRPRTMRPTGAITIDSSAYGRYEGELQIIRVPQPAEPRTNIVAMIDEDEINLIQYITPGRKFSFRFHT